VNLRIVKKYLKAAHHPLGYHCTHMAKLIFDYVEGTLDPLVAAKLEKHLADCPECIEFLQTYRSTKHLCHEHGRVERQAPPVRPPEHGKSLR
jgi:anti-sigma factor RsiW